MSKASNIANLRWAKQASGLGTPASTSVFGSPIAGGSQPKEVINELDLAETTGRQMIAGRVRGSASAGGDPQHYVRPNSFGSLIYAVLGGVSTSGSSDPYTHVVTPAVTLPFWTLWTMLANLIWRRIVDAKVARLVLTGSYGNPLMVTPGWMGLKPQPMDAEETTASIENAPTDVFMHSNGSGALMLEGVAVASIDDWTLTIDRGGAPVGGDSLTPIDVSEGQFVVTLAIRKLLLAASLRNRFGYGSATPTNLTDVVSTVLALGGSPAGAQFTFTHATSPERSIKIALPNVVVQPYDVDPAPGSDPLREQVTLQALDDGSTTPITVTVKNGRATIY